MLTQDEKATNFDTSQHISRVRELLTIVVKDLLDRANEHDKSKLEPPEVEYFTKYTDKLAGTTYNSPEYKAFTEQMKPAIEHHYANNRHHPQHWKHGVDDMNLVDVLEMLIDWKASSERHHDGNILKSIEINANRFGMSPQLTKILENTAKLFE